MQDCTPGGWLCVTRECDLWVQMCAWCTQWHVSGGDVVECVLACACDAELAVVGHACRAVYRAAGHVRAMLGGCLCVTHGYDVGVQKCAWCTPWHVSGRGVVGDVHWHVHAMWWWMRCGGPYRAVHRATGQAYVRGAGCVSLMSVMQGCKSVRGARHGM